jgi:ferrous iron transport protein A
MGSTASLDRQPPDVDVVIDHVAGADGVTLRLFELGLVPGAVVRVVRTAPLGDPLELAVLGTRVCVRRVDAARFMVRPAGQGAR